MAGLQVMLVGQYVSIGPHVRCRRVHANVHWAGAPLIVTTVFALFTQPVMRLVQAVWGSQVSPISTTLFPQRGVQLLSFVLLQPVGQQASPLRHAIWGVGASTHDTSQVDAAPTRTRSVHPMAGHEVAQLPSQVSPGSSLPLPQVTAQSLSVVASQPAGQQPSPFAQVVCIPLFTHWASQVVGLPCRVRSWHPMAEHFEGQLPSHSSVPSTMPLPHIAPQSVSLALVQPGGQQPSPFRHMVCIPTATQAAWQVPSPVSEKS